MAKSKTNKSRRRRPVIIIAILLALLLPIYAGLFFTDYRGVEFGLIITIVWYTGFIAAFILLLLYFALYVLPPHRNESWWEGVRMIWRSITSQFAVPGGLANSRAKPPVALIASNDDIPASFKLLRAGILRSHQVVAVTQGSQYVRAAGPGFVRLRRGERIAQLIDLRPHLGIQEVDAMTRDGIPIKLSVFVKSQIHRTQTEEPNLKYVPYKYDQKAVLNVCQIASVDDHNKVTSWSEQITRQAASYLSNAVSLHNLNTILADPTILTKANTRSKEILSQHFDASGIEIMVVGNRIIDVPEEVSEQRLLNWRAPMQRDVTIRRAEGDAEAMRRIKHARARAQIEIIQAIIKNIDEMRRVEQANLNEVITLRMIEELEKAMGNNTLQRMIPEQMLARLVMETQGQMRELLPPAQKQEGET